MQHDSIDTIILKRLRADARTPFVSIAKEAGVTEGTIRKRVERLTKKGILLGFTTRVHRDDRSVILISCNPESKIDSETIRKDIPYTRCIDAIYEVYNEYDFVIIVTGSKDEIIAITNHFKTIKDVNSVKLCMMRQ